MTQEQKILDLLIDAYYGKQFYWYKWSLEKGYVPTSEICALKIGQYNARIHSLRKRGIGIYPARYFSFERGFGTYAYKLAINPDLIDENGKRKACECGAHAWYDCATCCEDKCSRCAQRCKDYRHEIREIL